MAKIDIDDYPLPLLSLEEMQEIYKQERHKITYECPSEAVFDRWLHHRYGFSWWASRNDHMGLEKNAKLLFPGCKSALSKAGEFTVEMLFLWKEAEAITNNIFVRPYRRTRAFENYLNNPMGMVE